MNKEDEEYLSPGIWVEWWIENILDNEDVLYIPSE